jgi:hypothetical protein
VLWLVFLYLSPSLTYLAYSFLFFLLMLSQTPKSLKIIGLCVVSLIVFMAYIYWSDYHLQRLNVISFFSFDHELFEQSVKRNMSGLIYLQAWLDAYGSMHNTIFGSGFNRMGLYPRFHSEVLDMMSLNNVGLGGAEVDRMHGTVLFSKFIYEFGIFALLFILMWLRQIMRVIQLKDKNQWDVYCQYLLILSFGICCIRSPNYFYQLYLLIPFGLLLQRSRKKAL